MRPKHRFMLLFVIGIISLAETISQAADPLPSWNDGPTKRTILQFVARVTTEGGAEFVPVEQRIATFDNDGTLWCEKPIVQFRYVLHKLGLMANEDPALRQKQPFKAAFELDNEYLRKVGVSALLTLTTSTHTGMSDEEFKRQVMSFFTKAKNPTLGVPYEQVVYQPMLELLTYLRANGFKTYICSGGGIDFMRVVSAKLYGIPPRQVIGSSMKKELEKKNGKWILKRTGVLRGINDKGLKPVNIDLHVGQRPLLAVGNVRSGGDIGMLRYSNGRKGPSLQLLVNHDDAKREFAYAEKNNASLKAAKGGGWTVVSILKDWKSIFPVKIEKKN